MQLPGSPSWTIQVNPWPESFDLALWFRAAERIEVAAGGEVTGPPEVEPRPDPSTGPADGAELTVGWLGWWHALTAMPALSPPSGRADRAPQLAFSPPGFPGLARWPVLHRVVAARWPQASAWHLARKEAWMRAGPHRDLRPTTVVAELERELGRKARPFSVELLLLPVGDEELRPIGSGRYLVPERLYVSPRWPEVLRALLIPYA